MDRTLEDDEPGLGPVIHLPQTQTVQPDPDQCCPSCFPYGFRREAVELLKLTWPLSLSILFHYLIQPISLAFCGHLGPHQLAAVAMAISTIYITCVSFGRGLAFGGDTFFSQTYGSTNKMKMGIYLQKGIIFAVFLSCCIWAVLLNTENILLLIGQDATVAKMAGNYCLYFMPGVLAYSILFLLMRYLLCQNKVIPNFIICVICCGICALLHYGLLYQAKMGIEGSAISLMITYYLVLIFFFSYIWGSGIYHETWPGWSWEALEDWGPFARTCISSMLMTFLYWICTEVGTFLAGNLEYGEKSIAAFQIMFQVEGFAWMIPLGLGGACTARMGQFLGANDPKGAITTCRVSLVMTIFISIFLGGSCYLLKRQIPLLFTGDHDVADYTTGMMPILAIFLLFEGFGGCGVGIVRGSGRQTLGAIIIFFSYYVIALPVGIPLMFKTYLGLAGIWWGYVLGLFTQCLMLFVFVIKLNWVEEAHKAQVRAGTDTSSKDPSEPSERTRLLQGTGQVQSDGGSYERIGGDGVRSRTRLLLSRLAIFLFFLAILAAGIVIRLFVKVKHHQGLTEICIPNTNSSTLIPDDVTNVLDVRNLSVIIPFCNDTVSDLPASYGRGSLYTVWQGNPIP